MGSRFAQSASVLALIMAAAPALGRATESETAADPAGPAAAVPATATPQTTPVESTQSAGAEIEEIVVTAQFRNQNLQETPLSITAVNSAMMEARSQTNIIDVANRAPNVSLTPAGAGFGNSSLAYIRGIGQNDFNFALEPGVGFYIDDVYYGVVFGSIFDITDLDRVEILRGPQGTLAGKNSIGGAIKLFSKKPDGNADGYVEGTYGSFDRLDLRARADFPVVPEELFVRLSGVSKYRDGHVMRLDYGCLFPTSGIPAQSTRDNCELGTAGGQRFWGARAAARWLPAESIENNLVFDISKDTSEVQATKLLFQGPWAGGQNFITGPASHTNYSTFIGNPGRADVYAISPKSKSSAWGIQTRLTSN